MKFLSLSVLALLCLFANGQLVYRKGPTPETFRSDSLFTSDYLYTRNDRPFRWTGNAWTGLNLDGQQDALLGSTSAGIFYGRHGKKLDIEAYLAGGTGRYPSHIRSLAGAARTFPGYTGISYTADSIMLSYLPGLYARYKASDHISLAAGFDKNFIGQGYRSVLLSDNAANAPFIKADAAFWKLRYSYVLAYYFNEDIDGVQRLKSNKYAALHILEYKPWKWLGMQLFETVLWQARDSSFKRGIDINYLNPVIFFRPVEFFTGSADNALVGAGLNVHPLPGLTLYSQFLLDEFLLSEVRAARGWWGNKIAFQGGMKYFDAFGLPGLSVLAELNLARPYTYAHANPQTSYGHNGQPLAHPLGSNFSEALAMAQLVKGRNRISLQLVANRKGLDTPANYGGNIFRSYASRVKDYDNSIGQGDLAETTTVQGTYAYLLLPDHGLEVYCNGALRTVNGDKQIFFGAGIRTPFFNSYSDH